MASFKQNSPDLSEKEFPSLGKVKDPLKLEELTFKKYVVIKHNDPKDTKTTMADLNPIHVHKKLKATLGKHLNSCKVSRLSSGLLLVERGASVGTFTSCSPLVRQVCMIA